MAELSESMEGEFERITEMWAELAAYWDHGNWEGVHAMVDALRSELGAVDLAADVKEGKGAVQAQQTPGV